MKDNRGTRTSKLPVYELKRASNKPSKSEAKRMRDSLKVTNIYDGPDAS